MRECESLHNFEHGIESWEGGAVILMKNRCEGNSRNGIHADNGLSSATIEGNQLMGNREFGIVLDSAGSGKITGNTAHENLLGGMVIRAAAAKVTCSDNQITGNQGPGLILEIGLAPANYAHNSVSQNQGQQFLSADLSEKATAAPVSPTPPALTPQSAVPTPTPAAIPRAKIVAEPPQEER
jgi:parallel beta-helix repeat protein